MPAPSSAEPAAPVIPVVKLAQLAPLAAELARRVRASGFAPDVIVYVETGARLFAHELATAMSLPLAPVWAQRSGQGMKARLAPLARRLPVGMRNWLRRAEENSGLHHLTRRKATLPDEIELRGKRVLLLDDAADTGRTIAAARALLLARGLAPADLKTAVLAATTPRAQAAIDFFIMDRNCRMPWSADSEEYPEATRRAEKIKPPHAPRDL